MDNKQIGDRIKNRRKDLKFTLQEIADVVGVASSTIQRYESGRISQLKLPVLESIAKAINVNPVWLVKEDAPMETGISDFDFIKKYKEEVEKRTVHTTINLKDFKFLFAKEDELLDNFKKLNTVGKDEAIKRIKELTFINEYTMDDPVVVELPKKQAWEAEGKEHLMPIAAHDDNLTDEEKKNMDDKIAQALKKINR
ncbi:helix-turn-helix transcriptional regulator [Clostridium cadaveris]|uniref:helix-turn-helix domain-containing protein n=1 Tax=Clostridium cadaveris TaxID=1529 RepID=UPI0025A3FD91|nr:helix-turn-helix transcriptional regulator [Clostridium cadaveris]MDM8313285.1 helix-turn-helix transcriptional regulator [Clostridium cadaveris]